MIEVKEEFRSARAIGCVLRHFLPERVIYEIDTIQENANAIVLELQDDGRRPSGLRRHSGRKILLSNDVLFVLRDILQDIINFDDVFKEKNQQATIFEIDNKSMSFSAWQEGLRSLPHDKRLNIQQILRDTDDLFERILEAMKKSISSSSDHQLIIPSRPPRQIMDASTYLDNFFSSSLKYLGPLRDAPKPLYPLAPAADPYDVGLRGEHTASILDLHKNKKIKYIPSTNFSSATVDRKTVTRTLESAVTDWLQYLGVATSIMSCDKGKLGHELKVGLANSDSTHDLTHVGVGVSQVLPILVMCLLAEEDSTLVFEQPELHLHPKVQTLLGDFFLSMALSNKQCIVETHSEYFIDRLRFRIAAATATNELNSKTKIYFVEKKAQSSSFREVVINEYGAISDWPEGFFDQSQQQAEEILRAAAAKRKAIREKGNA
jgi:predicted ATPase